MRLAPVLSIAIIAASSAAIAQIAVPSAENKTAIANNGADANASATTDAQNRSDDAATAAPVETKPN